MPIPRATAVLALRPPKHEPFSYEANWDSDTSFEYYQNVHTITHGWLVPELLLFLKSFSYVWCVWECGHRRATDRGGRTLNDQLWGASSRDGAEDTQEPGTTEASRSAGLGGEKRMRRRGWKCWQRNSGKRKSGAGGDEKCLLNKDWPISMDLN